MSASVLLVDDDLNMLSSMKRQFRKRYDIKIAVSGEEALGLLKTGYVPSVIVCDMRMGGMNGVETLTQARDISPDTVRIMLTGNADTQTAITAINNGHIFRFLTKPCSPGDLQAAVDSAIEQYRLVTAERELLEKTLAGSVKVLVDMLAMASPLAFRRATRVRSWVRRIAPSLQIQQFWQLDLAAMLSPIGLLSIPPEVFRKQADQAPLSDVEQQMLDASPAAAKNIIVNIPRLSAIANIVYLQNKGFDGSGFPADGPKGSAIPIEARVLKILNALADLAIDQEPSRDAFEKLARTAEQFDPALVERIRPVLEIQVDYKDGERPTTALATGVLLPDMVLAADVVTQDGRLVLSAMMQISQAHVESLRNLVRLRRIEDSILVFEDAATVTP